MTTMDLLLFFLFALAFPLYGYLTWPSYLADARDGRPGVRVRGYLDMIVTQWSLALVLLAHWDGSARAWSLLGLGDPLTGRGLLTLAVVIAIGVLALVHARSIARASADQLATARAQMGDLVHVMPHTAVERWLFAGVALTAGVCEELFFRGLAPWLLSTWMPPWLAVLVATLLFGLAHAYQGRAGIPKTAVVGGAMAVLTICAGTLWPAILLHTIIDLHGGHIGSRIANAPR
jgi:uncharacterized protein